MSAERICSQRLPTATTAGSIADKIASCPAAAQAHAEATQLAIPKCDFGAAIELESIDTSLGDFALHGPSCWLRVSPGHHRNGNRRIQDDMRKTEIWQFPAHLYYRMKRHDTGKYRLLIRRPRVRSPAHPPFASAHLGVHVLPDFGRAALGHSSQCPEYER